MKDLAAIDMFLCRIAAIALAAIIWFPQYTKLVVFIYCATGTLLILTYILATVLDFVLEGINNEK